MTLFSDTIIHVILIYITMFQLAKQFLIKKTKHRDNIVPKVCLDETCKKVVVESSSVGY